MFPSLQLRIPQLSTRNERKDATRESPVVVDDSTAAYGVLRIVYAEIG
ncbi:MAG: hypothetical protein ACRELG_27695 [Gemmataceae bacterium]